MLRNILILLLILLGAMPGQAQIPNLAEGGPVRVILKNGSVLEGTLMVQFDEKLIVRLRSGVMTFSTKSIKSVKMLSSPVPVVPRPRPGNTDPPRPRHTPGPRPGPTNGGGNPEQTLKGDFRRVDAILSRWGADSKEERERCAKDLERIGSRCVPYLCTLLDHKADEVPVWPVALALGRIGDARALEPLARLMGSSTTKHRAAAVAGLAQMDTKESIRHLIWALEDVSPEVWKAASDALVALNRKYPLINLTSVIVTRVSKSNRKTPYGLLLGRLGTRKAHLTLREMILEPTQEAQLAAVRGLRVLGNRADADIVQTVLLKGSTDVRKEAALYLGGLRHEPAVRDLITVLHEDDRGDQSYVHWALCQITELRLPPTAELWEVWWKRSGRIRFSREGPPKLPGARR